MAKATTWIGIDVSKAKLDVAVSPIAEQWQADRTEAGVRALIERVQGDVDKLKQENPSAPVTIDLVTTTGSGLDPDISPAAALFQVPRVAKARNMPEDRVRQLVDEHVEGRSFGLLGEPRVNVLALNLALDRAAAR